MARELTKITIAAFDAGVSFAPDSAGEYMQHMQANPFVIENGSVKLINEVEQIPETGIMYSFSQETLFTTQNIVDHALLTVLHPEFLEGALIDLAAHVQIAPGMAASPPFTFHVIFDIEITGNALQGRYLGIVELQDWINGLAFTDPQK